MTSIRVEELYKVFGPRAKDAVKKLRDGVDLDEVRSAGNTPAVVDASFSVNEGETFVVMGLSGSGKSTLIRMLNGLLTPTAGKVYVNDEEITGISGKNLRSVRQQTMSMVFQHFALFPHRTVLDNAGYGLQVQGTAKDKIKDKATEALGLVGLKGWEDRYPQQLSGGMRQRVGLARALAAGTDILLMDEAFSALDPLIKREMQDQLLNLQSQLGKTIIFITHDLNEAMRLGDRIAVMRAGKIVQIGTSEQILNEPADDYVVKFVQDVDRSRVLTAAAVAEPQAAAVSADTAPADAVAQMRENNVDRVFVADGGKKLLGVLHLAAAEQAVTDGNSACREVVRPADSAITGQTPANQLFPSMTGESASLPVIDDEQRLLGVVTAAALFRALSFRGASAETAQGESENTKEATSSDA